MDEATQPLEPVTDYGIVPTAAEYGLPARAPRTWDTPSMHQYESWTDNDLYRAIEVDPAGAEEYAAELRARRAGRAAMAALIKRTDALYFAGLSWRDRLAYYVSRIRLTLGV